jgi:type II secretory pathway pseudopilin PulG
VPDPKHYRRRKSQRGVILLMMLITLALVIIALGVAAPKMAQAIKRDREEEMIHRGAQYARAVKKYYKKFGRYPGTIEQLENTNNLRFLRKRYADPMAKDGKWRPVKFGEVQLGQQGGGAGTIGGGGGGVLPPVVGGALNQGGGTTQQQTGTGQNPTSNFGPTTSFGPSSSFGQQGTQNAQGQQQQQQQQQGSTFGQPGQTFGGGAIMGVASVSEAKGFHEYNQKSQYKQWMFVYDPSQDRGALITGPYNPKAFVGQGQLGTPAGQANQPGSFMNNSNPGGQSNFGGQSTFGNQPSQPSPPPANNPQ